MCVFVLSEKDVTGVVTEEVREQLLEASAVTKKAITAYRREVDVEEHLSGGGDGQATGVTAAAAADKSTDEGEMSVIITIMQPILRLMQLLCENHNRELQVSQFNRHTHSHTSHTCSRHVLFSPYTHTQRERGREFEWVEGGRSMFQ